MPNGEDQEYLSTIVINASATNSTNMELRYYPTCFLFFPNGNECILHPIANMVIKNPDCNYIIICELQSIYKVEGMVSAVLYYRRINAPAPDRQSNLTRVEEQLSILTRSLTNPINE